MTMPLFQKHLLLLKDRVGERNESRGVGKVVKLLLEMELRVWLLEQRSRMGSLTLLVTRVSPSVCMQPTSHRL